MTEREVVLRERAAAAKAIEWVCARARRDYGINSGIDGLDTRRYVAETFPLPKVTRPRVVADPHESGLRWTVRNGKIAVYDSDHVPCRAPSNERIELWADLLARPTEEVDA